MSKKLVQINTVCNGSTGRIMEQIQKVAEEEGYETYSFYGRGKPSNDRCYKICNKLDILWSVFLTRFFDKHGYGCKRATKKLVKQIEKINPDVIQLHNLHGYYLNLDILFKYLKKCDKKIVWTLHDCWAFTGHCAYFSYPECTKWKTKCKNCERVKDYPKSYKDNSIENYLYKKELFSKIKNCTIITPSQWLKKLAQSSFLKEYKIKVINNGIDLQKFKPTKTIDIKNKYNIQNNKKIILGVASVWDARKGLNEFIKLSKIINNEELIIVLIGLTNKQIKKLPENIIGIDKTENIEELANLYTTADIYFNATLEDNFPTTNIESLACGTPVITYDTGGSAEVVDDNNGKVIEKLEEVIEIINGNKYKAKDCIDKAKQYNAKLKYKEYIEEYEG